MRVKRIQEIIDNLAYIQREYGDDSVVQFVERDTFGDNSERDPVQVRYMCYDETGKVYLSNADLLEKSEVENDN